MISAEKRFFRSAPLTAAVLVRATQSFTRFVRTVSYTHLRKAKECKIISKYYTADDFFIMVIGVQKGFAIRCMRPAVYLFLRNPDFDSYYDVPVSVLDVNLNDSTVTVGVRIISAKTKSLAEAEDRILVRGPYRSGFIGREFRKMEGTIMILASGAGICPGIFTFNLLRSAADISITARDAPFEKNMISRFLRPEKVKSSISSDAEFEKRSERRSSRGGNVIFRDFDSPQEIEKIRRSMRSARPDHVVLLGSREFAASMYKELSEFHDSVHFVTSNDSNICCGEGICGACEVLTGDGRRVRMCKCSESVDTAELFGF